MRGVFPLVFVLLVLGLAVSILATDEVDVEANAMAKAIEQESKRVEAESKSMVDAIAAKGRTVDSKEEEEKFEKASQRTDDVMDSGEKAVEEKANQAEQLQNKAETRMDVLEKKVEEIDNQTTSDKRSADKQSSQVIMGSEPNTSPAMERDTVKPEDTDAMKDKIEPSRVVVLPDVAIKGTDPSNMQVKELKGKNTHGMWLAVHIPDNATITRPIKIMATKNAAEDLEKVVGPNRETLFKELQTIIGVDGNTLRMMLKAGEIPSGKKNKKHHDEDEENEDESEDDNDDKEGDDESEGENETNDDDKEEKEEEEKAEDSGDDDDNNDDANKDETDECDDSDNESEDNENEKDDENSNDDDDNEDDEDEDSHRKKHHHRKMRDQQKKHNRKQSKAYGSLQNDALQTLKATKALLKKCSRRKNKPKLMPWVMNGSGLDKPRKEVSQVTDGATIAQPSGFSVPVADVLNKPRPKAVNPCAKITQPVVAKICHQVQQKVKYKQQDHYHHHHHHHHRHHHYTYGHNKYYKHLKRLMERYMDKTNNPMERQILRQINLLLSDQMRAAPDGAVHMYSDRSAPTKYANGINSLLDKVAGSKPPGSLDSDSLTMDDNTYNGHVIRVPGSPHGAGSEVMSSSQANVLNNMIHTKLGEDSSDDGMRVNLLKEELGRSNSELEEAQKEKARDAAIMDKYVFKGPSEGKSVVNWNEMQKQAEEHVNSQQVSVVNPDQVNLKHTQLPGRNPDIPSLGGYLGGRYGGLYRREGIAEKSEKAVAGNSDIVPSLGGYLRVRYGGLYRRQGIAKKVVSRVENGRNPDETRTFLP